MDGAFFQRGIIELLERRKAGYAIKVPFFKWLGLLPMIRERQRWQALREGLGCLELVLPIAAWEKTLRVVLYRKPVHHETKKNYQLDLFDPDDGYFEYSALSTHLTLSAGALWDFMAGRGAQEKTFAELKGEWALDVVPTHHYGANSAWQQISILGHNLLRNFQLQTLATQKPRSRKRTFRFFLQSLKTIRLMLIHQPARLVKPQGYSVLRFSLAPGLRPIDWREKLRIRGRVRSAQRAGRMGPREGVDRWENNDGSLKRGSSSRLSVKWNRGCCRSVPPQPQVSNLWQRDR
jgi:hypothetical protein